MSKPRNVFQTPQTIHESRDKLAKNDTPIADCNKQMANTSKSDKTNTASTTANDDIDSDEQNKENENNEAIMINEETVMPFNKTMLKAFHKSEPNLSNALTEKNSTPIFNRGKHIAKKLFSSVSMTNLRRSFAHHQAALPDTHKLVQNSPKTPRSPTIKSNKFTLTCNRSADAPKLQYIRSSSPIMNESTANETIHDSIGRESVSPITKSTHRMCKAMQVRSLCAIIYHQFKFHHQIKLKPISI